MIPRTYTVLIGGEGGVPWDTGASASKKGFAPRVGLAYRLGTKTVIRSGYGITIDPDNMRNQRNAFPSVLNQDFTPANSYMFVTTPGVAQASLRTGIPAAHGAGYYNRQVHALHGRHPRQRICRPPTSPPRSRST